MTPPQLDSLPVDDIITFGDEPRNRQWPVAVYLARLAGTARFVADLDPEERREALPGLLCELQAAGDRQRLEEIARSLGHLDALDAYRPEAWPWMRAGWLAGRDLAGVSWEGSAAVMRSLLEVLSPASLRGLRPRGELMDDLREAHADGFDATMLARLAR